MVKKQEKVSIFARNKELLNNSAARASRESMGIHHNEDLAGLETQSAKEELAEGDVDTREPSHAQHANLQNPAQTQATIKVDRLWKSHGSSRFLEDDEIASLPNHQDQQEEHGRMNDTFDNAPSSKNITNGQVLTSNYQRKDAELSTTRGPMEHDLDG